MTDLPSIIGSELNLPGKSVSATIKLLDDGATVPFIARYRKEVTGELDEKSVHTISIRLNSLREFLKRREYVTEQIKALGALTPELAEKIEQTFDPTTLEDIYLPFKPKRRTKAEMAREKGLEPLAKIIMSQRTYSVHQAAQKFIKGEVKSANEAIDGALDIIAEWISENEKVRNLVRSRYQRSAMLSSSKAKGANDPDGLYANYYDFLQPLRSVASHRFLAINRGSQVGVLKMSISIDDDEMIDRLVRIYIKSDATSECSELVTKALRDGYRRLVRPSIENEILATAKDTADATAIEMFSQNLQQLLLAPPMFGKRVMGIDPGFKTGCKVVCLDEQGKFLANDVIYPNAPICDVHGATHKVCTMIDAHKIDIIAVGTGTAGRETEKFLNNIRHPRRVQIVPVNEDGASVYSASEIAREEFPDKDITVRGAVSIGRRLLDPLAELVKIDPKSIGVGQYQHDVNQNKLKESLDFTVESCVNSVGVNINTASKSLLSYVSGIGPTLAQNIVEYRSKNGPFQSRQEIMNVARMGEKAFQQCAGFLRIPNANNPLDNTAIHPERYALVEQIARDMHTSTANLASNPDLVKNIDITRYVDKNVGMPTLALITEELSKPSRDPRGEALITQFDESISSIHDIHLGMELTGKVNNITAFGAFIDLGIKENGLIHISQMSERFISSPNEVVSIGQTIRAKVIEVETSRGRIALTLKGLSPSKQ